MQTYRERVETHLDEWLPANTTQPEDLHEAMRYAVLNGGKRVRAVLAYATGEALGAPAVLLDGAACAVELIHAYSLIHDDLPCMDDDDLRRGVPTCHIRFGEATALLAGDAMQPLAFRILSHKSMAVLPAERLLRMINILAVASGSRGMAGGQAIDLAAEGQSLSLPELENMHIHKTGALIRASVQLGALCAQDTDETQLKKLDHYAKCIGLAFQIRDDILDVEADTETLGKPQGADIARNKATYPALLGMQGAKKMAEELCEDAIDSLSSMGNKASVLNTLAKYIVTRSH